jgi:hypothetical protein
MSRHPGRLPADSENGADATERVPPWKTPWRAMLRHGRNMKTVIAAQ